MQDYYQSKWWLYLLCPKGMSEMLNCLVEEEKVLENNQYGNPVFVTNQ